MVQEDTITDAAVDAIKNDYNTTDRRVIDDFQNTVMSYTVQCYCLQNASV